MLIHYTLHNIIQNVQVSKLNGLINELNFISIQFYDIVKQIYRLKSATFLYSDNY